MDHKELTPEQEKIVNALKESEDRYIDKVGSTLYVMQGKNMKLFKACRNVTGQLVKLGVLTTPGYPNMRHDLKR